jgi:hypothetical protein
MDRDLYAVELAQGKLNLVITKPVIIDGYCLSQLENERKTTQISEWTNYRRG